MRGCIWSIILKQIRKINLRKSLWLPCGKGLDEGRKMLELRVQLVLVVLRVRQGDQVRTEGVRGKERKK